MKPRGNFRACLHVSEKTSFGPVNYILYLADRKIKLVSQVLEFGTIKKPALEYCPISFFKNPLIYQVLQLTTANVAVLNGITSVSLLHL